MTGLDRRTFVKLLGGGIVVFVSAGPSALLGQPRRGYPEDFNAYLRIDENGHVTVFSGKIEMGQGVMTSQAQMAAEELGLPLDAITMIVGDTDQCPWDMGTFGSLTTRMFGPALRAAAAEARTVLVRLGSKQLGVAADQLTVKDGVIAVTADPSKKVTYGELAKGRQISRLVGEKEELRAVEQFLVRGRSPQRVDGIEKVTGRAKYSGDLRLPGMLYARILRPPQHGTKAANVNTAAAKAIAGVTVVQQDDLVAALHPDPEVASVALRKITADWVAGPKFPADTETIDAHLVKAAGKGEVKLSRGDLAAAHSSGAKVFQSTYRTAYVAHAPMEPHTALAELKDGRMTVWASTQTPFPTRDRIAAAVKMDPKDVRVITPYVGGGFGGKSSSGQAIEAARLAQATGKPVMVAWTRSEEFFYDSFNPAAVIRIESAINPEGTITLWDYNVYAAGDRGTALFYDIPNASIRVYGSWSGDGGGMHPFAVGPWRAPGANMNVFAGESQIDVMAAAAGIDPLEFRLRNTSDARMQSVLKAAAGAFGWKSGAAPTKQGRAVACGIDAGTYVALMADVTVDRSSGAIRVNRVVCAQDMGIVVNPDGAKMQMEGCITMGLGYALQEELHFQGGDVIDRNFATYHLPRFSQLPKIETVLVKNDQVAPQGGGEPAIISMGAVIANAVFDATGVRMYRLPMTPERVLTGLKKLA